jgi:adenylate kinase
VVLLAPPGGGKSTQAGRLAAWLDVPHLALGDALRRAVDRGTELGRRARPYMEEGRLVPDEVIIPVVMERLEEEGPNPGYVLDGFPRDLVQATALDGTPGEPEVVLFLSIPDEEVVARLSGRRSCPNGHLWHVEHRPPSTEGVCDTCGAPLERREDDHPDAVRRRLAVYRNETEPLVRHYRDRGVLTEVDGTGDPDTVAERIREALTASG